MANKKIEFAFKGFDQIRKIFETSKKVTEQTKKISKNFEEVNKQINYSTNAFTELHRISTTVNEQFGDEKSISSLKKKKFLILDTIKAFKNEIILLKDQMDMQQQGSHEWVIFSKQIEKTEFSLTQLNDRLNDTNLELKEMRNPFAAFLDGTPLQFVGDLTSKFNDMADRASLFQSSFIQGNKGVSSSFKGFFSFVGAGFKSLATSVMAFGASMATVAAPIAIIVAAIYTLKKAWDINLGGVQTFVNKLIGRFKDLGGAFEIGFIKVLKMFEPIVTGFFDGLWAVIDPIFDLVKELGKVTGELFGNLVSDGQSSIGILDAIGFAFKTIGIILGVVIKAVTLLIKLISFVLVPTLKYLSAPFRTVSNFVSEIVEKIQKMIEHLISATEAGKKMAGYFGFGEEEDSEKKGSLSNKVAQVSGNQMTGSTQNNKNFNGTIIVNTSREITSQSGGQFANSLSLELQKQGY